MSRAPYERVHLLKNDAVAHQLQAISMFKSGRVNPRNLEYYVYIAWSLIIQSLTAARPFLHVGAQFPLWFPQRNQSNDEEVQEIETEDTEEKWHEDDDNHFDEEEIQDADAAILEAFNAEHADEDLSDSDEPHADVLPVETADEFPPESDESEDDDSEIGEWDESMITQAEAKTRSCLVDFAILQIRVNKLILRGVTDPELRKRIEALRKRYGPYRVTKLRTYVLIELKHAPTRSGTEASTNASLRDLMRRAMVQVREQATYAFVTDVAGPEVLAIAGAGEFWRHAKFSSTSITPMEGARFLEQGKEYSAGLISYNAKWSPLYKLNTKESDEAFRLLRERLLVMEAEMTAEP